MTTLPVFELTPSTLHTAQQQSFTSIKTIKRDNSARSNEEWTEGEEKKDKLAARRNSRNDLLAGNLHVPTAILLEEEEDATSGNTSEGSLSELLRVIQNDNALQRMLETGKGSKDTIDCEQSKESSLSKTKAPNDELNNLFVTSSIEAMLLSADEASSYRHNAHFKTSTSTGSIGSTPTFDTTTKIDEIIKLKLLVANQQATIDTMSSRLNYLEAQNNAFSDDSRVARLEAENSDLLHKLSKLQSRESQLNNELDREFSLRNALGDLDRKALCELSSSMVNHDDADEEQKDNATSDNDNGKLQLECLNSDLLKENSELLQKMLVLQVENEALREEKELQFSTASDPHQLPSHRRRFVNPFRGPPSGNTLDLSRRSWSVGGNLKGALDASAISLPCHGGREVPTGVPLTRPNLTDFKGYGSHNSGHSSARTPGTSFTDSLTSVISEFDGMSGEGVTVPT